MELYLHPSVCLRGLHRDQIYLLILRFRAPFSKELIGNLTATETGLGSLKFRKQLIVCNPPMSVNSPVDRKWTVS